MNTPWGPATSVKELATGITEVGTESHGGLILSADRWAELEAALGEPIQSFAGRPYLEEDIDARLAMLVWSGLFSPMAVWESVAMFSGTAPSHYQPMLAGRRFVAQPNTLAVAKARTFERRHADDYLVAGLSFLGLRWTATLRRIGDMTAPAITVEMEKYPDVVPIPGAQVAAMKRI